MSVGKALAKITGEKGYILKGLWLGTIKDPRLPLMIGVQRVVVIAGSFALAFERLQVGRLYYSHLPTSALPSREPKVVLDFDEENEGVGSWHNELQIELLLVQPIAWMHRG
ncbi:UNVERIFIED_CONTAM: hypothetical protein Sindi_2614000 [Sesamum indicum]